MKMAARVSKKVAKVAAKRVPFIKKQGTYGITANPGINCSADY